MKKVFSEMIKKRMAEDLPIEIPRGKYREKEYKHICKNLEDNFIDKEIPQYCNIKGKIFNKKIHYHQFATSLNSSQVMCISFFKQFFYCKQEAWSNRLLDILRKSNVLIPKTVNIKNAIYEYEPNTNEGTNFDFYLCLSNGANVSFEIKYTESEFGKISPNTKDPMKYENKWKNIYKNMVENNNFLNTLDKEGFYENYQINRNIAYASEKDYILFLTPRENNSKGINSGRKYIDDMNRKHNNIMNLYWEDIIEVALQEVKDILYLYDYYTRFKNKYINVIYGN